MKRILLLLLIMSSSYVTAQKNTREIISAENISAIHINTDEVYLINIVTTNTSEIRIRTHSEGEYFDDIILESAVKDGRLKIKTRYPERLTGGYDKLSAHKVFSLEIEMEVPDNLEVIISSNIASVQGRGEFKTIYADLKQGYFKMLDFKGSAVVNTFTGNIYMETSSGLIEANSRNGKVDIPEFLPGRNPLRLTSIDGDIMVRKN